MVSHDKDYCIRIIISYNYTDIIIYRHCVCVISVGCVFVTPLSVQWSVGAAAVEAFQTHSNDQDRSDTSQQWNMAFLAPAV